MSEKNKNLLAAIGCFLVLIICLLLLFGFIRNKITTGSYISFNDTEQIEQQEDLQVKDCKLLLNYNKE